MTWGISTASAQLAAPPRPQLRWHAGPRHPSASLGTIDLWLADLRAHSDRQLRFLDAGERARMAGVADPRRGLERARARGILRALLGRYLHRDPAALAFTAEAHGKPALAGPLSFSVSHSHGVALYAVSTAGELGIDVECRTRPIDAVALAARIFGEEQAARLSRLGQPERQREFLRLWTIHEARAKCLGTGIRRLAADAEWDLWTSELDLPPAAAGDAVRVGAVAASVAPRELRCWRWEERSVAG